jgi:hypothetical protein
MAGRILLVLSLVALAPGSPAAQTAAGDTLRVFLDCGPCDFDFLRREIPFVDYVRDRTEADVHILVTTQQTGGGGVEYTFKFIGLGRFAGVDDELKFVASQTDTQDERRQGYTRLLKLGLVRYVTSTASVENLQLLYKAPAAARPAAAPADDPWNFWVFRTRANMSVNGERSNSSRQLSGNVSANRTTEQWRTNLSANVFHRENRFTLSDGSTLTDTAHEYGVGGIAVRSVGPHWAAAVRGRLGASTFLNQDLATRLSAGVEYNVFPYSESSRRVLTTQATVGVNHFRYHEETIYGKMQETVWNALVISSFDFRQPWGSSGVSFDAMTYFHDVGRHRLRVNGDIDIRLFKGFSVNFGGSASRIRDQLYLRAGEATDEEILLRRRQLATSYRYSMFVGVGYTFGSIFNNIVNPRFRD